MTVMGIVQDGPVVTVDGVASVSYLLDEHWKVTVERELSLPIGGPTRLLVEAAAGGPGPAGIQQADVRAIPIGDARKQLEAAWVQHRALVLIAGLPVDFTGEYAFAKLAEVVCTLHGLNTHNPVGLIARHATPHTHGTWATRVKRARGRGFMTTGRVPMLTGKALAILR